MKKYTSFDEIDKDLRILKLKNQIAKQKASIDVTYLKSDLRITNLLSDLVSTLGKRYFYKQVIEKFLIKLGLKR
jgi:hypothetical protein